MSKYDEVLKPFVSLMERELHANSGKGDRPGWLSMSAYDCMLEIYYHAAKLQKAIRDGNGDGIAEYSADVANMAMMVADICGAIHLAAPVVDRQEPVIYEVRIQEEAGNPEESPFFTDYVTKLGAENYKAHHERVTVTPLYAEQPAPVAVFLDERAVFEKSVIDKAERFHPDLARYGEDGDYKHAQYQFAWEMWQARACIDKVKEPNQ